MTDPQLPDPQRRLSADEVVQAGLDDWRQLYAGIHTRFDTGDFAAGLELVNAIGELAEAADHHPDIRLTYPTVDVTLTSHDAGGVTSRDIAMARRISAAAVELGIAADPSGLSILEVALDTPDHQAVAPFWAAVLGYEVEGDEVHDPAGTGPTLWFQPREEDDGTGQRFHLDVRVPHDVAEQRVEAAVAAGGTLVHDGGPAYVVLADADGNKACICTNLGREGWSEQ